MFGRFIADLVEGVVDTVELTTAVAKDVVKSPVRLMGRVDPYDFPTEDFAEDTRSKIAEIKDRE